MPDVIEPPAAKPNFLQMMSANAKGAKTEAVAAPPAQPEILPPPAQPDKPAPSVSAPPPTATPAVVHDPDDEILTGKRSPKSDDFRRVKEGRDAERKAKEELRAKLEPVEKELTELRKAPKHNSELIKKLESERDDFKGKYEAFIVQFTPEFTAKFDGQIANVVAGLKTVMPEGDAQKLAELLQIPDSDAKKRAISEITEAMDQFQVAEVVAANREIRRINGDRREAITKANQTLSTIAQERQKQSEESSARMTKLFDEIYASATQGDKAIPVYQKREGDEAWNKGVEERARVARAVFNGEFDNPEDKAQAALWAAAAPGILADYKAAVTAKDAELAELKDTIAKLQGANPGLGTGSTTATVGKKSFLDRMMETAQ